MAENAKKKSVKSKLSKPNPKQKQHVYSIDVGMDSVRVIKIDAKGRITGNGVASYNTEPQWSDNAWIERFSDYVRDAARSAKVPKGAGFLCSVVSGGPNVIVQRFTWPELGHQAMLENAKHEIASYLPGTASNFVVSAEVQARHEAEGDNLPTMEVFVAAMPKDMATAITTAVTWAGFKVAHLDIYENVRTRLVNRYCRVSGNLPNSYGILDLCSPNPNITLYLDGFFYSTHYFTGAQSQLPQGTTIEEIEARNESVKTTIGGAEGEYNAEAYLTELTFVVDFIKYQERASNLECILVYGRTQSGFAERISAGLDIPVYAYDVWMNTGVTADVKADPGLVMDAYAASIPSTVIGAQHMMDLRTAVIVKNPMRRLVIQASVMVAAMLAILVVAILIPIMIQVGIQMEYNAMDPEYARVMQVDYESWKDEDIYQKRAVVERLGMLLVGVDAFYREFLQASVMVPLIFGAEVTGIHPPGVVDDQGFTVISHVGASADGVAVEATAIHFDHVAGLIEYFRDMMILTDEFGNAARFMMDWGGNPVLDDASPPRFILDFEEGDKVITFVENVYDYDEEGNLVVVGFTYPEEDYWPYAQFLFRNIAAMQVDEEDTTEFEYGTTGYVLDLIMRRGMGVR